MCRFVFTLPFLATFALFALGQTAATERGGRPVRCVGHKEIVTAIALSPDGKWAASGSDDHTLRLWDPADGKQLRLVQKGSWVGGVRFSPDGKLLATTGHDGIHFWSPETGKEIRDRLAVKHPGYGLSFSGDGTRLAVVAEREGVQVWDLRPGKKLRDFPVREAGFGRAWKAALSSDGAYVAAALQGSGGDESEAFPVVRVWEVESGKELFKAWSGATANGVAFSPDGRSLAAGGMVPDGADHNGVLEVWDWRDGTVRFRVRADKHGLFCLAIRPDGKVIATGGTESPIQLWDVATGALLGKLEGHTDQVHDLAFSADGKTLASAGRDKLVLIWRLDGSRPPPRRLLQGTWYPKKTAGKLPGERFQLEIYKSELLISYARAAGGHMIDIVTYRTTLAVKEVGAKLHLVPDKKGSGISPIVCRVEGDRLVIEAGTCGDTISLRGEWKRAPEGERLP